MRPEDLGLIGVHGLPSLGVPSLDQIEPLIDALCRQWPQLRGNYRGLEWATGDRRAVVRAFRSIGNGTLGRDVAKELDVAITAEFRQRSAVLVVAFSAGGNALYRWLLEQAVNTDRLYIVTVAAPHRCNLGGFRLESNPTGPLYPFGEAPMEPQDILQKVPAARSLVLLAAHDGTVLSGDADFQGYVAPGTPVNQDVILSARHSDVCQATATHQAIIRFARSALQL